MLLGRRGGSFMLCGVYKLSLAVGKNSWWIGVSNSWQLYRRVMAGLRVILRGC